MTTTIASFHRATLLVAALSFAALGGACVSNTPQSTPAASSFDSGSHRLPSAATLQSVARIMAAQGKEDQCELVLLRLVGDFPQYAPAYNELAELYLRAGRVESAAKALELGLAQVPEDVVLLNNLGLCHVMQKNYEQALAQFTAAAACDPADVRSRCNMAMALGLLGRMDEASALYTQSMAAADAHFNLGVLHRMRGDEDKAAEEFAIAESL